MTVIAFRPRRSTTQGPRETPVPLVGAFRSPSGRMGRMEGSLRVQQLVVVPRGGAFVKGVFTGRLLDVDGSLIGVDSRRATMAADLVRGADGYAPVVRPFQLVLMGMVVEVDEARVGHAIVVPRRADRDSSPLRSWSARDVLEGS